MTRNGFQDIISPATGGSGHGSFGSSSPNLKDLADCSDLATATDGQVPVWNDATSTWEPKTLTSPIIYLGNGAWDATKVLSKADNYGMPAHTVPDPQVWSPQGGDQYIDLATGNVTIFTGAGTVVPTHYRLAMPSALVDGTALSITITPQGGTPIAVAYRSNAADTSAVVLAADVLAALQAEASLTADFQFSLDTTTVAADSVDVLGLTAKAGAFTIAVTGGITSTLIAGGPTTPASPAPRSDPSGITAGVSSLDLVPNDLDALADVIITAPADGQILQWKTDHWENVAADFYTKSQTDQKLSNLVSSIEHEEAVLSIANTPPGGPSTGDIHIVGTAGTGDWAGQNNNLARYTGTTWSFESPRTNESHLVEDVGEIWHWNGTAWVKISSAVTGSSDKSGVGEIVAWIHGTIPSDYLPCDGRVVAIASYTDLHNIIGNTYNAGTAADGTTTFAVPDLRGYFLRGSGTNGDGTAGPAAGQKQGQATARPGTAFTTDSQGSHHHTVRTTTPSDLSAGWHSVNGSAFMGHSSTNSNSFDINTGDFGNHTHTITGGGDSETRPKNIGVTWVIRWKAINGGAAGPKGEKGDTPDAGSLYMVGDIKQSLLSETQFKALLPVAEQAKWVLADGRNVAGSAYATATSSTTVPDLRGAFLRMAGQNVNPQWTGPSLRAYQEDSTARPKTAFTTDSQGNHHHWVGVAVYDGDANSSMLHGYNESGILGSRRTLTNSGSDYNYKLPGTGDNGAHTHTITGGGDSETRPKSYGVNYFIKIN